MPTANQLRLRRKIQATTDPVKRRQLYHRVMWKYLCTGIKPDFVADILWREDCPPSFYEMAARRPDPYMREQVARCIFTPSHVLGPLVMDDVADVRFFACSQCAVPTDSLLAQWGKETDPAVCEMIELQLTERGALLAILGDD